MWTKQGTKYRYIVQSLAAPAFVVVAHLTIYQVGGYYGKGLARIFEHIRCHAELVCCSLNYRLSCVQRGDNLAYNQALQRLYILIHTSGKLWIVRALYGFVLRSACFALFG